MSETNNNTILVNEVKEEVKKKVVGGDGEAAYDPRDVQRLMEDPEDRWLLQFIAANKDVKSTVANIRTALQWRKDFGVNDLQYSDVSADVWDLCYFYIRHRDNTGHHICWQSTTQHLLLDKMDSSDGSVLLALQRSMVLQVERVFRADPGARLTYVLDISGKYKKTVDKLSMDIGRFIINLCNIYYPNLIHKCLFFKPPMLFNMVLKVFLVFVSRQQRDMIQSVDEAAIARHVPVDCLPPHMAGTDTSWLKHMMPA